MKRICILGILCTSFWSCGPGLSLIPGVVATSIPTPTPSVNLGTGFQSQNICSGATIDGLAGSAICAVSGSTAVVSLNSILQSNAYRTAGTAQITQAQEVTTFAGAGSTPSLPSNYRDVPNIAIDDEGLQGTSAVYAPRPVNNCGTTGSSIAARIANCNTTWDGIANGIGGEAVWKLVARVASNKEVWQDTRTGLFWSSMLPATPNWCRAAGNTQPGLDFRKYVGTGNGTIATTGNGGSAATNEVITVTMTGATTFTVNGSFSGPLTAGASLGPYVDGTNKATFTITAGAIPFVSGDKFILESSAFGNDCQSISVAAAGLQPVTPVSFCTEILVPGIVGDGGGVAWNTVYDNSKGNLGANSTPGVKWRLPTKYDYEQADLDGIRMVMPDMGISGGGRPTPDGSVGGSSQSGLPLWFPTLASRRGSSVTSWGFSRTLTALVIIMCVA